MGSTVRSLIVAARVDATGMDAGYAQAITKTKEFKAELVKINADIKSAQDSDNKLVNKNTWMAERSAGVIRQLKNERAEFIANTQLKQSLDRTYYVSTHTDLEVQLADRRAYYAELRTMHQNNAEMMMRIDRAQMAETAALTGGGPGGAPWSRQGTGRATRFMLLNAASGVLGPEIGEGVSYGVMAEMMGATAAMATGIGVGVAGAELIAKAYKQGAENAKEVVSIQNELNAALRKGYEALRTQTETTGEGTRDRDAIKTLNDARTKALQDAGAAHKAGMGVLAMDRDLLAFFAHRLFGAQTATSYEVAGTAERSATDLTVQIAKIITDNVAQEKIEAARLAENNKLILDRLRIEGEVNGPIRERQLLENKHQQEMNEARAKMQDNPKLGDLITPLQAQQAQENANLIMQQNRDVAAEHDKSIQEHIKATTYGRNQERALLNEKHAEELKEYTAAGKDIFALEFRQRDENLQLTNRFNNEDKQEHASAMEAQASLIHDAYDREVAMLKIKQDEELRLYQQEGKDVQDLLTRQAAEREAIIKQEKDWVKSQLDELDPQRQYDDYMEKINDAKKAGAISDADAAKLGSRWNKPIDEQIKQLAVERQFQQGKISSSQEQMELLKLQNPLAGDERIRELVELKKLTEKPQSTGEFSTSYNTGMLHGRSLVDFKSLHGSISSPNQQMAVNSSLSVSLLQAISNSLDVIKNSGGLQ